MSRLEENFTKFRYEDWLPLSNEDIYQLNEKDFQVINDLQEKFKEDLVDKSYLSMVDLLSINIRRIYQDSNSFFTFSTQLVTLSLVNCS